MQMKPDDQELYTQVYDNITEVKRIRSAYTMLDMESTIKDALHTSEQQFYGEQRFALIRLHQLLFHDDFNVRVQALRSVVKVLHLMYPDRCLKYPVLPDLSHLQGIQKIRALFVQYVTLTDAGSLERIMLALEIEVEKRKLNLPVRDNSNVYNDPYCPGDFSHLDLSYLYIKRELKTGGNFKSLQLQHCDLTGSTIVNLKGYGIELKGANLCGLDLSDSSLELETKGAVKEGMALYKSECLNMLNYRLRELWPKSISCYLLQIHDEQSEEEQLELILQAWANYLELEKADCFPMASLLIEDHLRLRMGKSYAACGDLVNTYEFLQPIFYIQEARLVMVDCFMRSPQFQFGDPPTAKYVMILLLLRDVELNELQRVMQLQACAALLHGGQTVYAGGDIASLLRAEVLCSREYVVKQLSRVIDRIQDIRQHVKWYREKHEDPLGETDLNSLHEQLTFALSYTNPMQYLREHPELCAMITRLNIYGLTLNLQTITIEDLIMNTRHYPLDPSALPPLIAYTEFLAYEEHLREIFARALSQQKVLLVAENVYAQLTSLTDDEIVEQFNAFLSSDDEVEAKHWTLFFCYLLTNNKRDLALRLAELTITNAANAEAVSVLVAEFRQAVIAQKIPAQQYQFVLDYWKANKGVRRSMTNYWLWGDWLQDANSEDDEEDTSEEHNNNAPPKAQSENKRCIIS